MGKLIYVDSKMNETSVEDLDITHLVNAVKKMEREGKQDTVEYVMLDAARNKVIEDTPIFDDRPEEEWNHGDPSTGTPPNKEDQADGF
tara:strand:- start:5715 stop:5978 length:264 start_codon:yes stop_codon:yes gene_type:complete